MPISIKVAQLESRKAAKLREIFELARTGEVFRRVGVPDLMQEVLQYARERSPVKFNEEGDADSFEDGSFASGWRVRRKTEGNRLLFILDNILERKGARGQAKFRSIELGSKAQVLRPAKKRYRFLTENGWVIVGKGRGPYRNKRGKEMPGIYRPAREGVNVAASSKQFILQHVVPQVADRVDSRIRRMLNSTQ